MTKNPFYNAGLAVLYIVFIVLVINFGSKWATQEANENLLFPIGMLSIFVISAAIMGFIVLYQPMTMFLDNKRKEGVGLFLRTIGVFAAIAFVVLVTALSIANR